MTRRAHLPLGVTSVVFALVVAAVGVVGIAVPETAEVAAEPPVAAIRWEPCAPEFECADYEVPLDHADPSGPAVSLFLIRHPATDPANREGTLFLNPGGPGGEAVSLTETIIGAMDPAVVDRFDIVGFTPRGVAPGTPAIACPHVPEEVPTAPADWAGYFEGREDDLAQAATACQMSLARTAPSYGTVQVAEDLDLLRRAVGDDGLTYWGISYGSRIGEVYAQLHPDRIRAMVLDGNVDPRSTALTFNSERGGSYDDALEFFFSQFDGTRDASDRIRDRLVADGPVEVLNLVPGGPPTEIDASNYLTTIAYPFLSTEQHWPLLARELDAVDQQLNNGGPTAKIYIQGESPVSVTVFTQVNCLDLPDRPTVEQMTAAATAIDEPGSVFGATVAAGLDLCSGFPLAPDPAPASPPVGLPPILLLASEHDPATPYVWSESMQGFLDGSVRVTYQGAQHGVWNTSSACINDIADAYVLDLTVPADGIVCAFVEPAPLPSASALEIDPAAPGFWPIP